MGQNSSSRVGSVCGVQGEHALPRAVPSSSGVAAASVCLVSALVDVEVTEVVEGGAQRPARLYVVHLLGQLWTRTRESSAFGPTACKPIHGT